MASLNTLRLENVASALGPLGEKVVFVGGVVAELLQTEPVLPKPRATDDVDAVIAVTSRKEYSQLNETLRSLGFREDSHEGAHAYRWIAPDGTQLDLVPVSEKDMGVGNHWDTLAAESGEFETLRSGRRIRRVGAPLFLAMKWNAFTDRGATDWMGSHDLEDIIAVIAGRSRIVEETENSSREIMSYVSAACRQLLNEDNAEEIIQGALSTSALAAVGVLTIERISLLANLGGEYLGE